MSEYKRKKHHRFSNGKNVKSQKQNVIFDDDEFDERTSRKSPLKVVKGKKLVRRHRTKIFVLTVVLLAAAVVILSCALPVGLMENINNLIATVGSGTYPFELSGNEVMNSETKSDYYYILTDTCISAHNKSGDAIYNIPHGFSKPILKSGPTRALVFDQGGNDLSVYNLKEKVNSYHTDSQILTAAISRDGIYAVAVTSNEYTCVMEVYDRFDKLIYKWNSAKDIINNITVSSSGKQIAVSTVNGVSGKLVSKIYVLEYDSADSKYSYEINGESVMALENCGKGFCVICGNGYSYIKWKDFSKTDYKTELSVDKFRKCSGGCLLVMNRENDRSDNRIVLFDNGGEKISEFEFNGLIGDIYYYRSHIYCINESKICVFGKDGGLIASADCGYGNVRIATLSSDSLAIISDSSVKKLDISF